MSHTIVKAQGLQAAATILLIDKLDGHLLIPLRPAIILR